MEVAIVGAAPSTRHLVNDLPEHVERWGMNQIYAAGFLTVADRWFEMHVPAVYDTTLEARRPAGHLEWLADFQGPVYQPRIDTRIPNSTRYPIELVECAIGLYLTSTVAYALALAITEQVEHIYLYGVDMASRTDYADQRPCCEYLIGLARGYGIKVTIPEQSPLCKGPVYGTGTKITDEQYGNRIEDLQASLAEARQRVARLEGALLEANHWANVTPQGMTQTVFKEYLSAGGAPRG